MSHTSFISFEMSRESEELTGSWIIILSTTVISNLVNCMLRGVVMKRQRRISIS
jgi:hypothetical protein